MNSIINLRIIKLIMVFAIFWMVIGELITLHQKKIFGNDLFGKHTPFTKPKSQDDSQHAQFKPHKHLDNSENGKINLFFNAIHQFSSICSNYQDLNNDKPFLQFIHRFLYRSLAHRGPPSFQI